MPAYAQLEQEAAWRAEVVPDAIAWFIEEAIKHWRLARSAVGCKGNNLHLRGAHRSRRWIKTSRWCTNRTYTVSHPDDLAGDEDWLVGIDITLPRAELLAACKRLDAAVRAGLIEEVSEWYGNTDGDDRVDGYNNIANRVATSDDSHLWHLHITIKRRFANTLAVLQRLFAILTGADDMEQKDKLVHKTGYDGRTVGHVLADESNLRDYWYDAPGGATTVNPPAPTSRADLLVQAAQKTLAAPPPVPLPVDTEAIVAAIRADMYAMVEQAAERAVRRVLGAVDGATPAGDGA